MDVSDEETGLGRWGAVVNTVLLNTGQALTSASFASMGIPPHLVHGKICSVLQNGEKMALCI